MFPVAQYRLVIPSTEQTVEARLDLIAKSNPDMLVQMQNIEPVVTYSQSDSGFNTWMLIVMALLVGAMTLLCIFMYSNRVRQMRMVAVAFLLNVAYVFLLFFWAVDAFGKNLVQYFHCGDLHVTWFVGAYAPIVSLVFLVLAHRGIKKDESMVRAADRLR